MNSLCLALAIQSGPESHQRMAASQARSSSMSELRGGGAGISSMASASDGARSSSAVVTVNPCGDLIGSPLQMRRGNYMSDGSQE